MRRRIRDAVAIRETVSVIIAYELAWDSPMTAPVAMFSFKMPVFDVMITSKDVRFIASEMPSSIPIIILLDG